MICCFRVWFLVSGLYCSVGCGFVGLMFVWFCFGLLIMVFGLIVVCGLWFGLIVGSWLLFVWLKVVLLVFCLCWFWFEWFLWLNVYLFVLVSLGLVIWMFGFFSVLIVSLVSFDYGVLIWLLMVWCGLFCFELEFGCLLFGLRFDCFGIWLGGWWFGWIRNSGGFGVLGWFCLLIVF